MINDRKVEDWITAFLKATENTEPPKLFREWTAVSTLAAVMQRKVYLTWGSEVWYPNMYVVLVGPSGSRKGTAMREGQSMLRELGHIAFAADATSRQALIDALVRSFSQEFVAVRENVTKPYNHCSLTIFSAELSVFLGIGNKQNLEIMADLCDWFDCKTTWTYETKSRGQEVANNVWVNLFAGTTPELVRKNLPIEVVGGGLSSRMMFVFEPKKGRRISFPTVDQNIRQNLLIDLENLYGTSGNFTADSRVRELYDVWYQKEDADPPFTLPALQPYLTRRPGHLLKLSMIMSASRSNELLIIEEDFIKALDLLYRTEAKMERTFSGYGQAEHAELVDRIIEFIAINDTVYRRDLVKAFYQDLDSLQVLDVIITKLQAAQFLDVVIEGRNKTKLVLKNKELAKRYRDGTSSV